MVQLSLCKGPPPDAKLAAMGLNGLASSVRPCFVEASPIVVLQSGPTHSHANFMLQGRTLQMRPWTGGEGGGGMWEPLMPDVVVPKVQPNNITAM